MGRKSELALVKGEEFAQWLAVFSRSQRAHVIRAFETVGQGDADDEGASGGFDDLIDDDGKKLWYEPFAGF